MFKWFKDRKAKKQKYKEALIQNRNCLVAEEIGNFYFLRAIGDFKLKCKTAVEDINMIGFTRIEHDGVNINVTVIRPGILIGRHGKDINDLVLHLRKNFDFKILNIIEEQVISCMLNSTRDYSNY